MNNLITFMDHQKSVLDQSKDFNHVAYYLDMGLGKTFVGAERLINMKKSINLVVCQKSKIQDWIDHFAKYYELSENLMIYDCTKWKKDDWKSIYHDPTFKNDYHGAKRYILVINYDLVFRRKELLELDDFTLLLDESSIIQNDKTKRTKFILDLSYSNVILLSGTPTSGKYENLWSQCHLLGWLISKNAFNTQYINWKTIYVGGFPQKIVNKDNPYKNVERLKKKMREHGAIFMKTEEVIDLPEQTFIEVNSKSTKQYKDFIDHSYVKLNDDLELIGDNTLSKKLYARQLCSVYNHNKLDAFEDLITSTEDRLIVFYNFNIELEELKNICEAHEKPISEVNGSVKNLDNYNKYDNSVTFVQYQAGSMGLNLQKANKIIYFALTDKSELFEQSKKRIHRIGQNQPCFYYLMICKDTVEEDIYRTLKERKDYTDDLFKEYTK